MKVWLFWRKLMAAQDMYDETEAGTATLFKAIYEKEKDKNRHLSTCRMKMDYSLALEIIGWKDMR